MAAHAVKPKPCVGNGKRRIIIINALRIPHLCPVPTVLRSLTVFDHDGPTAYSFRRLELVPGSRRGILLLYDHGSVRNYLGRILPQEPIDHRRRVINFDGRMNTVAHAVNKWSGVAHFFVFTPV